MIIAKPAIVTIAERPDLVPVVAKWIWRTFGHDEHDTLEGTQKEIASSVARNGPPQVFVLLAEGTPVGTASLVAHDLDERPDLTPWLASVYVAPEARGQGHAGRLVTAVEAACRSASISVVYLYTSTAEQVYERAGWHRIERFNHKGRKTALMRRNLSF